MGHYSHLCLVVGTLLAMAATAWAVQPTRDEMAQARRWQDANFGQAGRITPPFSFTYGDKSSGELLGTWQYKETNKKLDKARTQKTQTYTDPATGLQVRVVLVSYKDSPTLEWTVYLKNTGKGDTPILENIQGLDIQLQRDGNDSEFVLHHNQGSHTAPTDFQPFVTTLDPGTANRIGGAGGCPMSAEMPYFNLQWGRQGMIVVMGWTGQSMSQWTRDNGKSLRITIGQELTHLKLLPGEEIRTPLIVLQFWQGGDLVRSHNIWRRWMIAHSLPRPGGKPMPPVTSAAGADFVPNLVAGAADELPILQGLVRNGLKLDYWWRDAGWYPCGDSWWWTGTWEADPVRYPKGLKEIADAAHADGMKFTVWWEPERLVPGSWLAENHPEWLLKAEGDGSLLMDLGKPEVRDWIVTRIDKTIRENHIDMYRQDYNINPLPHWRSKDTEDRQGITENLYVQGLYAFWDELKRRFPNMPFDNCAGGGRRNDIEMMRRGLPLSRTDACGGTTSSQCQTHGLAPWLPYFGAGSGAQDFYTLRSNVAPWTAIAWDTRKADLDYPILRRHLSEVHKMAPYMFGDFYPLTPYSLDEKIWMAWQFDLPEKGKGMVEAFRRTESPDESVTYKLHGLEPETTYQVSDLDSKTKQKMTGRELMENGLTITTKQKPWASVFFYAKVK